MDPELCGGGVFAGDEIEAVQRPFKRVLHAQDNIAACFAGRLHVAIFVEDLHIDTGPVRTAWKSFRPEIEPVTNSRFDIEGAGISAGTTFPLGI